MSTTLKTIVCIACLLFAQALFAESNPVIIDVRSTEEYNSGHIENAWHMPHTEIGTLITKKNIAKDTPIILYCRSGGRAGKAKKVLSQMGYTAVKNGGGLKDMQKRFSIQQE